MKMWEKERVPTSILVEIGNMATRQFNHCCDNWTYEQLEWVRDQLVGRGLPIRFVPLDKIKSWYITARKSGLLEKVLNGHGPGKGWKWGYRG